MHHKYLILFIYSKKQYLSIYQSNIPDIYNIIINKNIETRKSH